MSVQDLANGLVDRCRQGDFAGAIDRYYADNIVSIESFGTPEMPREARGIEAVRDKNEQWAENNEVHAFEIEGPFVGESGFAVRFMFDITSKPTGKRNSMTEMALYTVENDRIVREEFFYNPAPSSDH